VLSRCETPRHAQHPECTRALRFPKTRPGSPLPIGMALPGGNLELDGFDGDVRHNSSQRNRLAFDRCATPHRGPIRGIHTLSEGSLPSLPQPVAGVRQDTRTRYCVAGGARYVCARLHRRGSAVLDQRSSLVENRMSNRMQCASPPISHHVTEVEHHFGFVAECVLDSLLVRSRSSGCRAEPISS